MSEEAFMICMPVVLLPDPTVPSTIRACTRCGQQVWLSEDSERVRGRVKIICTPCAQTLPEGEPAITKEMRERFYEVGLDDEMIEVVMREAHKRMREGTFL